MKFSYVALEYTQGQCTSLLAFNATPEEILKWGGVPAKNDRFHGGFQRALSKRYEKIIKFFNDNQTSPGSIVVAFRPDALRRTELGYPSSWPSAEGLSLSPRFVHLEIETDDYDSCSLYDLISRVRAVLEKRPGFASLPEQEDDADESPSDQIESEAPVDDQQETPDEEDDLDVGQSKLRQFYDFIGDQASVEAWIEAENRKQEGKPSKIVESPEERLRSTLESLLKPAMIVDGQHRVNGAAESETEPIQFSVCALRDADWVEQVFQFVVLNRLAKAISKDFLTELLNTSLTNDEVNDIDRRLETIGIKNADRRIHKYINHDERSPFLGLVAEAGEVVGVDSAGKLSQRGMLTLAKRWRSISGPRRTSEMNCYMKYLGTTNLGAARDAWEKYENWIPLFFAFWTVVREKYEKEHVWVKADGYNLLYIVTLQALQDMFIIAKAKGRTKFDSLDDFRMQVSEFFQEVPAAFFTRWTQSGLQSGHGWDWVKAAIELFQNGAKLDSVQRESELFKT